MLRCTFFVFVARSRHVGLFSGRREFWNKKKIIFFFCPRPSSLNNSGELSESTRSNGRFCPFRLLVSCRRSRRSERFDSWRPRDNNIHIIPCLLYLTPRRRLSNGTRATLSSYTIITATDLLYRCRGGGRYLVPDCQTENTIVGFPGFLTRRPNRRYNYDTVFVYRYLSEMIICRMRTFGID